MSETINREPINQEPIDQSALKALMTASKIIPVIQIDDPADAVPLATALKAGGLTTLEITLRTEHGLPAIKAISEQVSGVVVGAGTVISPLDYQRAVMAGSEFIVSPGVTDELLEEAKHHSAEYLPGVAIPADMMRVISAGFSVFKFFPAEASGGVPMLKALLGPFPSAVFCPTGGISPNNLSDYLALPNVLCVGGSWMVSKQLIADKNWQQITQLSQQAVSLFDSRRTA